jgi:hypothetical protein
VFVANLPVWRIAVGGSRRKKEQLERGSLSVAQCCFLAILLRKLTFRARKPAKISIFGGEKQISCFRINLERTRTSKPREMYIFCCL